MQEVVADLHAEPEFARSAKRFRLLLSSALSIFVFTFQGSIEAALTTFDCKDVNGVFFLRSNPKVQCSFSDDMYSRMVTTTIIGLTMYCALLPALTIVTMRSRWCRETFLHDSTAYSQLFGFLTSMYSKTCVLWELVTCARKVVFVAIPILVSKVALVQSVSMFVCLIMYAFAILKMQPMSNSTLNQIEILSCISVIVGSFSSIFFVVEYNGKPVLAGSSRDLAGLMLVLVCATCALLSLRLMRNEYSSKPAFHACILRHHNIVLACYNHCVSLIRCRVDDDAQRHICHQVGCQHHQSDGRHVRGRLRSTHHRLVLQRRCNC